ncbi:MAG: AbrB/MazE/SpoVT family DNA-binding domain-containing protein [Bifidobacteriaceae bacterium]|jgi:AbrB family looped-hinge helix DNA binding protein|nr:AbrB/MazE/SpoVT family DNA-binding domain-containing protein [Bifidobacteriaceae bacterium]
MTTPKTESTTSFPWQHLPSPGKMYGTATLGERGQLSIPADARRELHLDPGDKVVVFGNKLTGGITLLKADVFEDFADFFMTKLNKLGEHAQAFFGQFTEPSAASAGDDSGVRTGDQAASGASPEAEAAAWVAEVGQTPAN